MVYRSPDGGESWKLVKKGAVVLSLTLTVPSPASAFAGTLNEGLLKTTDGGKQWEAIKEGLPDLFPGDGTGRRSR